MTRNSRDVCSRFFPWDILHRVRYGWWPDEAVKFLLGHKKLPADERPVQLMDEGES